ncbi:MAG TPA: UDP-3-O-acyl-N-acetylglucosamine deacetylase [Candidatus Tumulicola sp.]
MTQATLGAPLHFEGIGLHTGTHAAVDVEPASDDNGIVFDLEDARSPGRYVRVPALAENVIDTSRATVIGREGVAVSTTEHLLSALFAMGVTNADIRVRGREIPIADGSARSFAEAIARAGVAPQRSPRAVLELDEPFALTAGDRTIVALPADAFRVRFVADFPAPIGVEYYDGEIDARRYADDIAGARTFGYLHEVEALRARGLALGGSLETAIVFSPEGPMQPLRWHNEVVRHKVLDLIGDFALLGAWPQCDVVAIKSGHELHASATRALRAKMSARTVR